MSFFARLFMPPYELALKDPQAYVAPFDAREIEREIAASSLGSEIKEGMLTSLEGAEVAGKVTLDRLVGRIESMRAALANNNDRSLDEFGREALAYDLTLADFIVKRANALFEGAHAGAQAALGSAFIK